MLSVTNKPFIISIVMLNDSILSVVMLSVFTLSFAAPLLKFYLQKPFAATQFIILSLVL